MPRPRSERQSLEAELAELPGQIAGYERELAATPAEDKTRCEWLEWQVRRAQNGGLRSRPGWLRSGWRARRTVPTTCAQEARVRAILWSSPARRLLPAESPRGPDLSRRVIYLT